MLFRSLDEREPELDFAPSASSGTQSLDAAALALAPLAANPAEASAQPELEIELDPRLRPEMELEVSPEGDTELEVSPERDTEIPASTEQVSPQAPTTLREAAVTSVTEPNHDSAMSEPSNQT